MGKRVYTPEQLERRKEYARKYYQEHKADFSIRAHNWYEAHKATHKTKMIQRYHEKKQSEE